MGVRDISPTTAARITSPLSLMPLFFKALPAIMKAATPPFMLEMPRPCTLLPTMRPFRSASGSMLPTIRRSSAVPVKLVSVWPLKPRLNPVPVPLRIPTALGRSTSISWRTALSPFVADQARMNSAIAFSLPVGLGMLVRSQPSCASSSRSISAKTFFAASLSRSRGQIY